MKTLAKAVAISALALAGSQVMAEDVGAGLDLSGNVGLVSDYLFRGISQSNNGAAVQGGFDLKHADTGLYAGTWLSSLNGDYDDTDGNGSASAEQDWYVGYGYKLSDDVSFDARLTQYKYLQAAGTDYSEVHASTTFFGVTLGADYTDDFRAMGDNSTSLSDNTALHYYANYSTTLPMDVVLSATYGRQDFKGDNDNLFLTDDAYSYWNLGVSKKVVGINWGLAYSNTSLSDEDCANGTAGITSTNSDSEDACEAKFVLSANKSL